MTNYDYFSMFTPGKMKIAGKLLIACIFIAIVFAFSLIASGVFVEINDEFLFRIPAIKDFVQKEGVLDPKGCIIAFVVYFVVLRLFSLVSRISVFMVYLISSVYLLCALQIDAGVDNVLISYAIGFGGGIVVALIAAFNCKVKDTYSNALRVSLTVIPVFCSSFQLAILIFHFRDFIEHFENEETNGLAFSLSTPIPLLLLIAVALTVVLEILIAKRE